MKSKEKLERFDDVFKLSLTLLAITFAFGSRFFGELGLDFFLSIVMCYIVALVAWSIDHLFEHVQFEVCWKLAGWYGLTFLIPAFFLNFAYETDVAYARSIYWPLLIISFLSYWLVFRYLKEYLQNAFARWIMQTAPLVVTILVAINALVSMIRYYIFGG